MLKNAAFGALCFLIGMTTYALAQTQAEMNQEAKTDLEIADAELNKVYKALRAKLSDDRKTRLKEVQLIWLKYRDKNAAFEASLYEGGSIAPMVHAGSLTTSTVLRTEQLKGMFAEGYEEDSLP